MLAVPGLPDETERTVYVDPYTAAVRGSLDTWYDTPPLQTTLDALHRNLLLGEPGRIYSDFAASWLWVLVLGGLALWIGRRRRRAPVAEAVLPPLRARPGRRMMGWHGATGIWLAIALLFISATGLTWSSHAGAHFQAVVEAVKGSTPELAAEPVPAREAPLVAAQAAVDTAHGAGLTGLLKVTMPAGPGAPVTVAENAGTWPVQRDAVSLDPYTGAITETAVARLADHGEAHPDRHPRPHGQPLRPRQPARPRGDGSRPPALSPNSRPIVAASGNRTPVARTVHRPGPPRRSVAVIGAMSTRQKAVSGASRTATTAARTSAGEHTARVCPGCARSSQRRARITSAVSGSPPCGAAAGSASQVPTSSGCSAPTSSSVRPAQDPRSQPRRPSSTSGRGPRRSAVSRHAGSGAHTTRSARRFPRPASAHARPRTSSDSSAGKAAAAVAAVGACASRVVRDPGPRSLTRRSSGPAMPARVDDGQEVVTGRFPATAGPLRHGHSGWTDNRASLLSARKLQMGIAGICSRPVHADH